MTTPRLHPLVKAMRANARTVERTRSVADEALAERDRLWREARAAGVHLAAIAAIYGVHYSRVVQVTNPNERGT